MKSVIKVSFFALFSLSITLFGVSCIHYQKGLGEPYDEMSRKFLGLSLELEYHESPRAFMDPYLEDEYNNLGASGLLNQCLMGLLTPNEWGNTRWGDLSDVKWSGVMHYQGIPYIYGVNGLVSGKLGSGDGFGEGIVILYLDKKKNAIFGVIWAP